MYYAFELYPSLPPVKVNGFERPRGKVHCFESQGDRSHFVAAHERISCISAREAGLLAPVGARQLAKYAKIFKG
jgi:hypothetical protein